MTITLLLSLLLAADLATDLGKVKRVYIDKLTTGEGSEQIRDLLISAVAGTGLFVLTENPERADAFLRGGAEDRVFQETFDFRDGVNGRAQLGTGSNSRNGSRTLAGLSVGEDESARQTERKHDALAAVRLVDKDGDVIWSTLQQSAGTKFRNASVDVVRKIADQLKQDVAAARKPATR